MSQDLLSSLITSKKLLISDEEYFEYSSLCDECPFLSQISTLTEENSKIHILQFGKSLHSFFQQNKDFAFLESLNIAFVLASIFKYMNEKENKSGILVPSLSVKKIYYFGGMIKTSMYLKGNKKVNGNDQGEKQNKVPEKEIKNGKKQKFDLKELEKKQVYFLTSLLYQLITKKEIKSMNGNLGENNKLAEFPELKILFTNVSLNETVKKLESFIFSIKSMSSKFSQLSLSFEKEDHIVFQNYSLEVCEFLSKIKPSTILEEIRDNLFLGFVCVSVRRFIVYYVLYIDKDFVTNKWMFDCLTNLAIQGEKLEIFYETYFEAAIVKTSDQHADFLNVINFNITMSKVIGEMKKDSSMKNDRIDILNKYLKLEEKKN